jgi:cytochrome c oxidase subunit 2
MSAILPPSDRLWWKQPIDKVEWAWIAIAFVWGMIMFVMMIYWHIYGKQNLSNEAYKTTPGDVRRQGREVHRREHRPHRNGRMQRKSRWSRFRPVARAT